MNAFVLCIINVSKQFGYNALIGWHHFTAHGSKIAKLMVLELHGSAYICYRHMPSQALMSTCVLNFEAHFCLLLSGNVKSTFDVEKKKLKFIRRWFGKNKLPKTSWKSTLSLGEV